MNPIATNKILFSFHMTDYGLVSIITPTYNSVAFVAETIESIIAQTYLNWELLVTDDCSTDETCSIIERYAAADKRIKLFRLDTNSGAGSARNFSIDRAQGRYIAFCDSDDRWYPEKLEKQLAFMTDKDCGLSYTSYLTCDERGDNTGIVVCRKKETLFSTKCDNGIGCSTAIYDTQKVGKIRMPLIRKRQDWGLLLRILSKCRVAYGMKEPLAIYRLRNNSLSQKKSSLIKYNIAVYKTVLGWSSVKSNLFFGIVFAPAYTLKRIRNYLINT